MRPDVRRRTRRRLLLAGLPFALVALALQWKVAGMFDHDRDGRAFYAAGAFDDAQEAFASNRSLNLMEAWISPYDDGTAQYRLADFSGAVRSLEVALASAPKEEECRVRINLALAHEAVGDEAAASDDPATGRAEWQQALDVLKKGGCRVLRDESKSRLGSSSLTQLEDARAVDARLREKLGADDSDKAVETPARARAELLEERNNQGERDRRELEDKKQDQPGTPPAGPPDDEGEVPSYEW
jgi:tetratricopeptide (TPR) repeat protein